MPEIGIRWIKITTDMFDNAKIKLIRKMPEGDAILNMWVQLICMAGTCNKGGSIVLGDALQYTDEMLAIVLDRDLPIVRLALSTLQSLRMIEWQDGQHLFISNFEKHPNIEGLDKVRVLNAARNQQYRQRQKQLLLSVPKIDDDVSVTSRDATDKIRREEKREESINIKTTWNFVLEKLKTEISPVNYKTWLAETQAITINEGTLIVAVQNEAVADNLRATMKGRIENCLCGIEGNGAKTVEFLVLGVSGD